MELDEIYQDEIIDRVDSPAKDVISIEYEPSVELKENKNEEADKFSARMSIMDEANGENPNKKSFLLFAKHYPSYHHYSYKGGPLRRLNRSYPVLPEIKGQTLNSRDGGIFQTKNNNQELPSQVNTLHDLTRSILRYGGKSDVVWMKFPYNPNGEKLVRPGYSARRYMANMVKHLNDDLVDNLIAKGRILEQTLFQSNLLMPHIRRRISTDLSRYPEPYRIIKQMLISPGPLNEYSFIWKNSDFFKEEAELKRVSEMKKGDIKILSKTNDNVDNEIYEEVQYAKMSREKQKTILSNLLLKSAMSHALKMKDKIIEHNFNAQEKHTKESALNIHIPIIKFDMMEAVTDLLNKETLETLSSDMKPSLGKGAFKGQALRQNIGKTPINPESVARPSQEKPDDQINVITIDKPLFETELNPLFDSSLIPNLTFRLNATNTTKPKRKYLKSDGNSGRQSALSNKKLDQPVFAFDPADVGLPDFQSQKEAQSNAYVQRLKIKAAASAARKEVVMPYGKYREVEEPIEDPGLNSIGDIDPTVSFSNWKYHDVKNVNAESGKSLEFASMLSSGHFPNNSLFNSKISSRMVGKDDLSGRDTRLESDLGKENDDNNRLIQLLSEHAGAVADSVLNNAGGGEDFASDVNAAVLQWNEILKDKYFELFSNVAIMEILMQKKALANWSHETNGQIWNLDVEDMKHQEEYEGMIKNIFKSIFKEQLTGIGNDDVNISPEIMALLQDGSKLALDHIEVSIDPTTGLKTVKLKNGVSIKAADGTTNDFLINLPPRHENSFQSSDINSIPSNRNETASSAFNGEPEFDGNSPLIENRKNTPVAMREKTKSRLLPLDSISHKEIAEEATDSIMSLEKETGSVNNAGHTMGLISSHRKSIIVKMIDTSDLKTPEKDISKETGIELVTKDSPQTKSLSVSDQPGVSAISNKNSFLKSDQKKSKHDFIVARVDDAKDIRNLYSQAPEKPTKNKSIKKQSQVPTGKSGKMNQSQKKIAKQNIQKPKKETESEIKKDTKPPSIIIKSEIVEKKESQIIQDQGKEEEEKEEELVVHEENENDIKFDIKSGSRSIPLSSKINGDDQYIDDIPEEELSGDDDEIKEKKRLIHQNREVKRNAGAEKRRLDVDRKRKEKEEQRKMENKRREMEESMTKKLDEERHQREEEYRLKLEKEKEEELRELDAVKYQEFMRQKQIDRERREKEEFNRKLEEMKLKQSVEDQKRREEKARLEFEEAERLRIENEMISRMREDERISYLKRKADEENRKRIQEEEERRVREEQAQLALEEAQRIAQKQARERALLEARLNFVKGLRIENVGMKKFLNITPTFVWSYFEFLKILGLQPNPTTNKLESDTFNPVN